MDEMSICKIKMTNAVRIGVLRYGYTVVKKDGYMSEYGEDVDGGGIVI